MTNTQQIETEIRLYLLTQLSQSVELSDDGVLLLHHKGQVFGLDIFAYEVDPDD